MDTLLRSAWPVCAAVLGLILGSFYNVCIHRYLTGESIVSPPSHCPHCKKRLGVAELIPLFSFLYLRGRCAGCGQPISPRYPLVEALSGLWACLLALNFGLSVPFFVYLAFGGLFIVASFIDLAIFILPDVLTLPGAALALPASVLLLGLPWAEAVAGALAGAGLFWLLHLVYRVVRKREGLGLGDVKLMLVIGALIGVKALPLAILWGSLAALLASVAWLKGHRGSLAQVPIPFGPFLSLGAMAYILFGPAFLDWYWRTILPQ